MYTLEDFDLVIGMEVHAQVASKTKLFSPAELSFGDEINKHVSIVDAGMPGALPAVNKFCIEAGIKTALALNMNVAEECSFDRKHYSYPDLPLKYQITQFFNPIGYDGFLNINGSKIRIDKLSLEADAAKNAHEGSRTVVDLNRCGSPLMEIVTAPDISSAQDAADFYRKIRNIVRTIGTCYGNMDMGQMRADVNISLKPKGAKEFGERVEIKNINSINFAYQAILFEANRHLDLINRNETIIRETRTFDPSTKETITMREKETDADYRYLPEPDLGIISISRDLVNKIKDELPELPDQKIARWMSEYEITEYEAKILAEDVDLSIYFDNCLEKIGNKNADCAKLISNWLLGDFSAYLNKNNLNISENPIKENSFMELINAIHTAQISGKQAKDVFKIMCETGENAAKIIEEKGISQISDEKALADIADQVIEKCAKEVTQFRDGNERVLGFLIGQAMKISQGRANPDALNKIVKEKLKN